VNCPYHDIRNICAEINELSELVCIGKIEKHVFLTGYQEGLSRAVLIIRDEIHKTIDKKYEKEEKNAN